VVDDPLVEVVTPEVGVSVGGEHLEHWGVSRLDLQDRDIEGAASKVVNGDLLILTLGQTVGQRRRRGLIDDT
jgi:hypothetical protein